MRNRKTDLCRKLFFEKRSLDAISTITFYDISNLVIGKTENKYLAPFGGNIKELCFYILCIRCLFSVYQVRDVVNRKNTIT